MQVTAATTTLRLEPLAGPTIGVITIPASANPVVIGRSAGCDVVLLDVEGVVSRKHCQLCFAAESWTIEDLGSRHGTRLNQESLQAGSPRELSDGDRLRIGLWTFRVRIGLENVARRVVTTEEAGSGMTQVQKYAETETGNDSHRRLELLMACAARVGAATSETEIGEAVVHALLQGCGFPRAAIVRAVAGLAQVEVIASQSKCGGDPKVSRSLIAACQDGQTVVMTSADAPRYGDSIVSLGIAGAVCTPVMLDGAPDAYLYLDARLGELRSEWSRVSHDVVSYCQAVARVAALAMANVHRFQLEREQTRRKVELEAARDVQAIIMPPPFGRHGVIQYAMRSIPGRFVAGDLFDFIPINEDRAALILGDVVGKGVAAGMIMSNVQAHLSRLLRWVEDPAEVVAEVNTVVYTYSQRYCAERQGLAIFLSLLVVILDAAEESARVVDAGHGHWLLKPAQGEAVAGRVMGGPPVGVVPDAVYRSETIPWKQGSRLIAFSDGVVEQRSPQGEQFGMQAALRLVNQSPDAQSDVREIVDAVTLHAGAREQSGTSVFADDVTVASVAHLDLKSPPTR